MSFSGYAIKVNNLGKCYQIYNRPQDRLKQAVLPRIQKLAGSTPAIYYREFWALRNVSFEIQKGETVGIVGRNGSGKSTLLQLISGTLIPTQGTIQTTGRLAALLELGSGFNPEFTGRENVYLSGAILGLTTSEINNRFDEIAAFADIGEFIEQPVKLYSSGMYVRLAFAINIMSQPDIMIVDEALAVGDMNFQAKCITALKRRQEAGTTVLLVSHDINSIKSLCSRAIYLEHGKMKNIGNAAEISEQYIRTTREEINADFLKSNSRKTQETDKTEKKTARVGLEQEMIEFANRTALFRYGTGEARVTLVELLGEDSEPIKSVQFDQIVKIRIHLEVYQSASLSVNFNILDDKKNKITGANFFLVEWPLLETQPGEQYLIDYSIRLPLQEGNYAVQVALTQPISQDQSAAYIDFVDDAFLFTMSRWSRSRVWSKVYLYPSLDVKRIVD